MGDGGELPKRDLTRMSPLQGPRALAAAAWRSPRCRSGIDLSGRRGPCGLGARCQRGHGCHSRRRTLCAVHVHVSCNQNACCSPLMQTAFCIHLLHSAGHRRGMPKPRITGAGIHSTSDFGVRSLHDKPNLDPVCEEQQLSFNRKTSCQRQAYLALTSGLLPVRSSSPILNG